MHPEADALLDAIFDNPDDDTPRLVYADWLQEHGHEDYAQFIRLAVQLARQTLPHDERTRLRRQRHLLGREIVKAYPEAVSVIAARHPPDGIPWEDRAIEAAEFVNGWQGSWPFVRPRRLTLLNLCGHETRLRNCDYLARVVSLRCEGHVINGWGTRREDAEWQPVAGVLLAELACNPHLHKLTTLSVERIQATTSELLVFAESPLAQRLNKLHLWVQFPDGSREDLRTAGASSKERIRDFAARHAARLLLPPA